MARDASIIIVFTLIGVSLLVVASFYAFQTLAFLNGSLVTKGIIISGGTRPRFRFVDQRTGTEYSVHGRLESSPPRFTVGQEVEIFYDPENPSNARINERNELWFLPLLLAFLGIPFVLFGLLQWRMESSGQLNRSSKAILVLILSWVFLFLETFFPPWGIRHGVELAFIYWHYIVAFAIFIVVIDRSIVFLFRRHKKEKEDITSSKLGDQAIEAQLSWELEDQLKELKERLDKGTITQEEYEQEKKKLMQLG